MATFDVHQHLWPEELVKELRSRTSPPCLRDSRLVLDGEGEFAFDPSEHDPEQRLAIMDRDGTDVALLSLQPTLGIELLPRAERESLLDAWHEGALRLVAESGGRLRPFATGRCLDGFAGACLSAADVVAGGRELHDLLDELATHRQVLFVHPGPGHPPAGAPPWWSGVVEYTAGMQAAYFAWWARGSERGSERPERPRVVFALLAGGGPIQLERLVIRGSSLQPALDPGVFFDVSSYGRRALELCFAALGVNSFLYGSDLPVVDPRPTLQAVGSFGDAVAAVIREENPALLFA